MHQHLWGIIVATIGPARDRGRRSLGPSPGRPLLFRQTLERAARLVAPDRLVAVLTRDHSTSYDTTLAGLPPVRRVVQPAWRGTAPALYLPLLRVAHEDPHATVVLFPADHPVDGEVRFISSVRRAADAAARRPDLVLVIGAQPSGPDDRSWIEPGEPVAGLEPYAVRAVRRFLHRPRGPGVAPLDAGEALVNTHVVVGRAQRLLTLGRRRLPGVLESLEPLEAALGRPEEAILCEAVYEHMPYADLAHALFVRPRTVAVVAATGVRLRPQCPVVAPPALAG